MEYFMQRALLLAQQAEQEGEVPVGAVIVHDNKIIAEGYNQPITRHDPTAHAEIIALRAAGLARENYRLNECDLYVTLEPCLMCAAAMVHARIRKVVYAASDPKSGVVNSCSQCFEYDFFNHHVEAEGGLLQQEAAELLTSFFKKRRKF